MKQKAKKKTLKPVKPCHCMVCQHGKEIERIIGTLKDNSDKKILQHFYSALEDVETTAETWKAKAYGAWPGWEHNRPKYRGDRT